MTEERLKELAGAYIKETLDSPEDQTLCEIIEENYTTGAKDAMDLKQQALDFANDVIDDPENHQDAVYSTVLDYYQGAIAALEELSKETSEKLAEVAGVEGDAEIE